MPKVWCAAIECKHCKGNECTAKEINLTEGQIHTVYEGVRQVWTCRAFVLSEEGRKLKEIIKTLYKKQGESDA